MKLVDDDGTEIGDLTLLPELTDNPNARYILTVKQRLTNEMKDRLLNAWNAAVVGHCIVIEQAEVTVSVQ